MARNIPIHLIKDAVYCVNYLRFLDDKGEKQYLYIAVKQDDMPSFQEAIRKGGFEAEDYGIILEQGKNQASKITKEKMAMLYNCKHDGAVDVLDYQMPQAK